MKTLSLSSTTLPSIIVSLDAETQKKDALALSVDVLEVSDPLSQASAVEAMAALKQLISGVEAARVDIKKPALEFGRQIDLKAKEFSEDLEKEYKRLQLLVGAFQEAERKRALAEAEAQRKALEEYNRQEAARRREEEEAQRKALESGAPPPKPVPAPVPRPLPVAAPIAEPPRTKGLVVGEDWELTELNLAAVYAHDSKFVKLTLNVTAVKEALRSGALLENPGCPGLKITKVTKARV